MPLAVEGRWRTSTIPATRTGFPCGPCSGSSAAGVAPIAMQLARKNSIGWPERQSGRPVVGQHFLGRRHSRQRDRRLRRSGRRHCEGRRCLPRGKQRQFSPILGQGRPQRPAAVHAQRTECPRLGQPHERRTANPVRRANSSNDENARWPRASTIRSACAGPARTTCRSPDAGPCDAKRPCSARLQRAVPLAVVHIDRQRPPRRARGRCGQAGRGRKTPAAGC